MAAAKLKKPDKNNRVGSATRIYVSTLESKLFYYRITIKTIDCTL